MKAGLLRAVEKFSPRTVAVVGLAKNCGKTTALNHLAAGYSREGIVLGATSAGRDGEVLDALTGKPKPAVNLPPGSLAVTAEGALGSQTAPCKVLRRLECETPMGELVLVRTSGPGKVELAGPPTVSSAMEAVRALRRMGAGRILVDGALDRIAVGHPELADAVVLAVGAVLAGTPLAVARIAAHRTAILGLDRPPVEDRLRLAEIATSLGSDAAAVMEDYSVRKLSATALADPELAAAAADGARFLLCGGAVVADVVEALLVKRVGADIVARDATRVFLGGETLRRWRGSGGRLFVLRRINLAAVVTNPHNPTGPSFHPARLIDAVARRVDGVAVYDVVAGLAGNEEMKG